MKRHFIVFLLTIAIGIIIDHPLLVWADYADYQARVEEIPGLVGFWKMDETSGTTMIDSYGSGSGTYTGATLNDLANPGTISGNAPFFDGINDYASTGSLSGLGSFAYSFWARIDTTSGIRGLINSDGTRSNYGFDIYLYSNKIRFRFGEESGNQAESLSLPSTGTWHYFVMQKNNNDHGEAYIDLTPYPTTQNHIVATLAGPIDFAKNDTGYYIPGHFSQLAIYDHTLNATQRASLATPAGPPTPTPTVAPTFTPRSPHLIATLSNGNQFEVEYKITAGDIAQVIPALMLIGLLAFIIILRMTKR